MRRRRLSADMVCGIVFLAIPTRSLHSATLTLTFDNIGTPVVSALRNVLTSFSFYSRFCSLAYLELEARTRQTDVQTDERTGFIMRPI